MGSPGITIKTVFGFQSRLPATWGKVRGRTKGASLVFILFLFGMGHFSDTWAIDIYHFLVLYKNGRVVERIFPETPESYQGQFQGYVAKTKLIQKHHYSVDGFIRTFGEKSYENLMTGYFGFGSEEEIIFNRQTQGFEIDPQALPPPDKSSDRLMDAWRFLEEKEKRSKDEKARVDATRSMAAKSKPPDALEITPTKASAMKKVENPETPPSRAGKTADSVPLKPKKKPQKETTRPSPPPLPTTTEDIMVYRFLAQYINGKIMEKRTAITPEQYRKQYREYVTKTALIEKKPYSKVRFKKAFGRNAHLLLIQGSFGVGDIEMIMQSRMERGMPPRKDVLPAPGPESKKLKKKLENLSRNRNFTLQGPP